MKKITVSAPGKLMLFGEHAVLHNHPCLVTAVDQRMYATIELLDENKFELNATDLEIKNYSKDISQLGKGQIPNGVKFAEIAVKNFIDVIARSEATKQSQTRSPRSFLARDDKSIGIKITTHSEFSSLLGFGSSSAVTVCIIKALSELFNLKLNNKQVFDLSYKTVLEVQSKGSGFDIASAIYGGTIYFETGGKLMQSITANNLPLIVGYSGIKADTVSLINHVNEKFSNNKKRLQEIYNEIEIIVKKAKQEIENNNWRIVGELMNENQKLLSELGVSIKKLDDMISASLDAGAFGAKVSGAGGGDCMIAIAGSDDIKSVENAIKKTGVEIINIQPNAEGVHVEQI